MYNIYTKSHSYLIKGVFVDYTSAPPLLVVGEDLNFSGGFLLPDLNFSGVHALSDLNFSGVSTLSDLNFSGEL